MLTFAQSKPPTPSATQRNSQSPDQTDTKKKPTNISKFGTENFPFFVKVINTPNPEINPQQSAEKTKEQSTDWWMFGVTFLLFLVGGFQCWLFFWQLRLIRESLIDTKKAANAAGIIEYTDAFGIERETRYKFFFSIWSKSGENEMTAYADGNDYT